MSKGKSLAAAAVRIGVTRKTIYNWASEHPEFAEAIQAAKEASLVYWEDLAEQAIRGEIAGNASIFNFQMKNRFRDDYQDSTAMQLSGGEDPLKFENKHTISFVLPE